MLILLLIALFPSTTWSQNRVGNGGDIVKCANRSLTLDLYESNEELLTLEADDEYKYAEKVIDQLRPIAPSLGSQYKSRLETMKNEIEFRSDIKLNNIKDSNHLFKPADKDCKIEQIAVRKNEKSNLSKRFLINSDLWSKLDKRNKAALLTHEIIYEHFYKLGEEHSVKARELNRWLYEKRFQTVTKKEFWNSIKTLKIPLYQN